MSTYKVKVIVEEDGTPAAGSLVFEIQTSMHDTPGDAISQAQRVRAWAERNPLPQPKPKRRTHAGTR